MTTRIGILAGSGELPARLVAALRAVGREVFVIAFEGTTDPGIVADVPHAWLRPVEVGRIVDRLKGEGCRDLVLAGAVRRPDLASITPDRRGLKLLPRLLKAARRGDGALLGVVVEFLEEEGFRVIGAEDVLGDLLAPAGTLTRAAPDQRDGEDIAHGVRVVDALGALDVGQAAVVRGGLVLGVEAVEGTDALLHRCAAFRGAEPAGVLVKLTKPGQERRVDLPTIGVATVAAAAAAGLRGIAIEAEGALIVDRAAVVAAADRAGIFIHGVSLEGDRRDVAAPA